MGSCHLSAKDNNATEESQTGLKKTKLLHFFQSAHADANTSYDNVRYYAIYITASQFIDKPRNASASVTRSCRPHFL